jgi:ABC-type bacteriocin/lantibiotic exporter with double-glycine peptidase domain
LSTEKRLVELREVSAFPGSLKLPAALFILSLGEAALLSALPVVAALLTDRTVQGKLSEILFNATLAIAGGAAAAICLGLLRDRLAAGFQAAAMSAVRQSVYDHLQQLSVPFCTRAAQDELPAEIESELVFFR